MFLGYVFEADEYINKQANKGLRAQKAHDHLKNFLDVDQLPCERADGCPWKNQSTDYDDADPDITFITHEMARAGMFREDAFLVIDEMPQYQMDIGADSNDHDGPSRRHLRTACELLLEEVDAPIKSWDTLVAELQCDVSNEAIEDTRETLEASSQPPDEWYLETDWAHKMDMPILLALLTGEEVARGWRYKGDVAWPEVDAFTSATEQEQVTVLLDQDYNLQRIWNSPNFTVAETVLCLDAHPFELRWRANIGFDVGFVRALDEEDEKQWRRTERNLYVKQVGNARRPLTQKSRFSPSMTRALLTEIHRETGGDFRSAIVPQTIESEVREMFEDLLGVKPKTMHYGEQFGMDTLGDEDYGAVIGHVDPGDDDVMDYVAYHELDAEPAEEPCPVCACCDYVACDNPSCEDGIVRAHDRKFRGSDRSEARRILNGVVKRQVAQALGRWARNPHDEDDQAIVYIWTSVVPDHLVDEYVEGVNTANDGKKLKVVKQIADGEFHTIKQTWEAIGTEEVSREWVRRVLREFAQKGWAVEREGTGPYNADEFCLKDNTNPFGDVALGISPQQVFDNKQSNNHVHSITTKRETWMVQQQTEPVQPPSWEEVHRQQWQEAQRKRQKKRQRILNELPQGA